MKLVAKKVHQKTHMFTNIENQVSSKLINWSSGYFDLFLQEDLKDKLIIYCPNGSITIQYYRETSELKLTVENKRIENCIEYFSRILQLYQNMNEIVNHPNLQPSFNVTITAKRQNV
ncbi:hypothetical protein [Tenacibaculum sp. 190524A05c]|uniref:Uncharacterized protein n=1 Tax=Tenacibaculum platacis TaxID=3137852 RepID=A0ABM9P3F2_9FLAO